MTAALLLPGAAHPYAPTTATTLAKRYSVTDEMFTRWVDAGLPIDAHGLGDPFAVANWISWNRLPDCPVLRRAWRGYLLVFSGFLGGDRRPRQLQWQRRQRICSDAVGSWTWLVPRPWQGAEQVIEQDDGLHGQALPAGPCWRLAGMAGPAPHYTGQVTLRLTPVTPATSGDRCTHDPRIAALVSEFVAGFHYEYRHHDHSELFSQNLQSHGSCLDAARSLAAILRTHGHDAHVVSGIIAHDTFANPHFWIEITDGPHRWPIDPSLPAIARMLGADWRAVAAAYTGGCDARRVRLTAAPNVPTALGGAIGHVSCDGVNAWPCLDWVCGECEDSFIELTGSEPAVLNR